MSEQPTPDGGATVTERIEQIISHRQEPKEAEKPAEAEAQQQEASEAEAPESDAQDEAEGPQLELSDAAKILGIDESILDVDEDGTIKIKTKIDGQEGAAKLNDLIKSYQLQGHVDAKSRQVSEMEKAVQARMQHFEAQAAQEVQRFETFVGAAQHIVMQEFNGIDWDELSRNDPIEYVAKQQAFNSKNAQIQQLMAAAHEYRSRLDYGQMQQYQAHLESEEKRLPTLVPEWNDAAKVSQGKAQLSEWLSSKGANINNGLGDAVIVAMLHKAMTSDRVQSKAPEVEKKVRSAPKLVRPGQAVDANQRNREGLRDLRDQIRKTGGKGGSVAEYLIRAGKV